MVRICDFFFFSSLHHSSPGPIYSSTKEYPEFLSSQILPPTIDTASTRKLYHALPHLASIYVENKVLRLSPCVNVKVLGVRVPAVVTTFVTHPYLNPIHP
jgi:hypothetical protein